MPFLLIICHDRRDRLHYDGRQADSVDLLDYLCLRSILHKVYGYLFVELHFEGNSLIAAGDEDLIKIHFHTNEPWKILEYCSSVGEIFDIVVEDMIRQSNGLQG